MLEHVQLDQKTINKDLLGGVLRTPSWWLPTVIFLLIVVCAGLGAFGYMMNKGLGVTGLNRPVLWGFFLVNFVFWIGISHAGIMISAILRLTQAEWRRPVTRAAEVMTVVPLMAADLFGTGSLARVMGIVWPFGQVGQATLPFLVGAMHDRTGNYDLALVVVAALGLAGASCIALLPGKRSA